MDQEFVVLVDKEDQETGIMEKMEAHQKGLLHRAISVFIFNEAGEMLIQQRAATKYHSPLLWTNTCCSHPRAGESAIDAANRRLMEEMGMECGLKLVFKFQYRADMENGLIEHELDHIFIGYTSGKPQINRDEVNDYKYEEINVIRKNLNETPNQYTKWFKLIFEPLMQNIENNK